MAAGLIAAAHIMSHVNDAKDKKDASEEENDKMKKVEQLYDSLSS